MFLTKHNFFCLLCVNFGQQIIVAKYRPRYVHCGMLLLFFSLQITEHWTHLSLNTPWKVSILIHCIMCGWQQNLKEVKVPQLHRFQQEPSNTVSTYSLNTLKKI